MDSKTSFYDGKTGNLFQIGILCAMIQFRLNMTNEWKKYVRMGYWGICEV